MATLVAGFGPDFDPMGVAKELGLTPTSGFRTQAHQEALIRQGLTNTRNSAHTRGDAMDFAVPEGMTKAQAMLELRKRFPGAKMKPTNGNAIHVTFPGWGKAPDVSNSKGRY